jgi:DNA repair protein RecO (recombination protein O)
LKTYKARGIVLHTIKYGESGMVAYMLTDVLGRATYMVQGVRSTRGHGSKAALLQPVFLVEFEGVESTHAEMHRLREIRAAVPLCSIPFDVCKSTVALFMAEMLYRLVREVEANSTLFEFVFSAVQALDRLEGAAVANFHLWFMAGLARHLGFAPGNEWASGWWFDIREGIFTPVMPRGEAFSRENAALFNRLLTATVTPTPSAASMATAMAASTATAAGCAAQNDSVAAPALSDTAPAASTSFAALSEELSSIALSRTRRVDFLGSMLAYFGYHLDATRDIRSVDILREVF